MPKTKAPEDLTLEDLDERLLALGNESDALRAEMDRLRPIRDAKAREQARRDGTGPAAGLTDEELERELDERRAARERP